MKSKEQPTESPATNDRGDSSGKLSFEPRRQVSWPLLLVVLGLGGGLIIYFSRIPPEAPGPVTKRRPADYIPGVRFVEITGAAGLQFKHYNGASGEKLLPETMGSGCAFFDYDQDGDQDIFLVNGCDWPWRKPENGKTSSCALYANNGQGKFENATAGSGLEAPIYGMGVAVGDYDNDGLTDLFVTGVFENRLYKNQGKGKFEDLTARAGLKGATNQWSSSAAWFDHDNDGDLDLFVCNYVQWSREMDVQLDYKLPGVGKAYGPPANYAGTFPYLYRNEGNGRFTEASAAAGLQIRNPATGLPLAKSLGVAPVDLDNDGWMDLVVANDTVQNFVFHNERNGSFKEIGARSGVAYDVYGAARGAMGIDTGRFQDENSLGISIGNFANEMTALYVSQQDPLIFSDQAMHQGIGPASQRSLTFGVFFFDYDLDGWLDLLTANGHIEPEIQKADATQNYKQPPQLFWNSRESLMQRGFLLVPKEKSGWDLIQPLAGRGSAYADIDGDGDLDVLITQVGEAPLLLRNDQHLKHHWVRLKLVGRKSNRDAIGAWVQLRVNGRSQSRQVMPARGYLSQSELPVTFGLGKTAKISEAEILWPDGTRQKTGPLELDRLTVIEQSL